MGLCSKEVHLGNWIFMWYTALMKWNELQQTNRPIVLYGTGDGAEKVLAQLSARGIIPAAIFASDGFVRNRAFAGFPVMSYAQAKEQYVP